MIFKIGRINAYIGTLEWSSGIVNVVTAVVVVELMIRPKVLQKSNIHLTNPHIVGIHF